MNKKVEKILEWGIYLWIFLLPWQTRLIIEQGMLKKDLWEYGTVSLYAVDILLIILFILRMMTGRDSKTYSAPTGRNVSIWPLAVGLLVVSFISIYWARDSYVSLYGVVKVAEGILLYRLISSSKYSLEKAGIAFVASAVVQSVISILQFTMQKTVSSKWLGMASHESFVSGTSVVETATNRFLRAYGSLPHPNILAGFLAVGIIILLGFYLHKKTSFNKYILGLLAILIAGLYFSFSRAGWLGVLIAIIYFLATAIYQSKNWRTEIAKIVGVIAVVFIMLTMIYPETLSTRIVSTARLEQKSFSDRATYFQQATDLLEENWLHGVGINNYTLAVKDSVDSGLPGKDYQPVHNVYLLVFTELGFFGLVIFLAIILSVVVNTWQEFSKSNTNIWVIVYAGIFGIMLVLFLFDHYFWTLSAGIMLFWLVLGLWQKAVKES
jgi:O-antigen ligase